MKPGKSWQTGNVSVKKGPRDSVRNRAEAMKIGGAQTSQSPVRAQTSIQNATTRIEGKTVAKQWSSQHFLELLPSVLDSMTVARLTKWIMKRH